MLGNIFVFIYHFIMVYVFLHLIYAVFCTVKWFFRDDSDSTFIGIFKGIGQVALYVAGVSLLITGVTNM
jgi:hypothetical protein